MLETNLFDEDELNNELEASQEFTLPDEVGASRVNKLAISQAGDEIDKALISMPMVRAPRHTLSRVLASIATLPQLELDAAALSIGLMPSPKIKYMPPVMNLEGLNSNVVAESEAVGTRSAQFNPLGYLFIGLWLSVCLIGLYLVWPGIANLIFGPPQDSYGLARLQALQGWWDNFSTNLINFFNLVQPFLPTIVSVAAGVVIMLYIMTQQRRRLWME